MYKSMIRFEFAYVSPQNILQNFAQNFARLRKIYFAGERRQIQNES